MRISPKWLGVLALCFAGVALAQVVGPRTRGSSSSGSSSTQFTAISFQSSDSTGTPGAATINKISGRFAIGIGTASALITNNKVTASSHVFCSKTNGGNGVTSVDCYPSAGQITAVADVAATDGDQWVDFIVVNSF